MSTSKLDYNQSRRRARTAQTIAASVVVLLVASACTSNNASKDDGASRTLRIGEGSPPNTLDPGNLNPAFDWYTDLAYDPLIYMAPDGSLQPRLATSWNYVGTGNKVFELHLRSGIKFSDGTPLTADVVKANLDRYRQTGMTTAFSIGDVSNIAVVNPSTVRLTMSKPDPLIARKLNQSGAGDMVSGPALKNPKKLSTETMGAGPYVLDENQTVASDHYTYTPNPNYWNKSTIHYGKITINVLPDPNTALAAIKTGQVDVIQSSSPATDSAAKAAGLQVVEIPQVVVGLALADRGGKLVRALGDVRVRQAMNYAVNRTEISSGLRATAGDTVPTEQVVLPGQDGYNQNNVYTYDPTKAKQLLAAAGYPNGFTLPVVGWGGVTNLLQVVSKQLEQVGVRLNITDDGTNANKYLQDVASGKYPAYGITYGTGPVLGMAPGLFLSTAAQWNPFHSSDAQVEDLYQRAIAADPPTRADLDKQIVARLVTQAWFVPVYFANVQFYARHSVTGIRASRGNPIPDPVEWQPK